MKLALALAVAASLADVAISQSTISWIETLEAPALTQVRPVGVEAHPAGGSVAVFAANLGGRPRLLVRRMNENGGVLWATDLAIELQATVGPMRVTSRGSTVAAIVPSPSSDPRLVSFDASGQLEWEVPLDSSVGGAPFLVAGLGVTSTGDIFVGAIQDAFTIPIFSGSATVRCFRGDTGAELWRHESIAVGTTSSRVLAAFRDDRAYLVYQGLTGVTAEALDSAGNLLYSSTGLQPGNTNPVGSFIEPGPAGTLAFGHWTAYVSQDCDVVALDATGAVSWTQVVAVTWGIDDAAWTSSGDIVLLEGGSSGRTLTRLGPGGTPIWQHAAPMGTSNYVAVLAGVADDVVATAYQQSPAYPYFQAKLEFVDAAGATVGEQFLSAPSRIYAAAKGATRDGRGNLLVATNRYQGFMATSGAVVSVIPGGDPSTVTCTQTIPNSTGQTSRLRAAGSARVAENRLTLVADRLPEGAWVVFLDARIGSFVPNPNGSQGNLCLGGTIGRYLLPGQLQRASAFGMTSLLLDLPMTPSGGAFVPVVAGETWHFQAWHRDVVGGMGTSNFTDALSVTFH